MSEQADPGSANAGRPRELQQFTSQTRLGTHTYLADEETGERLNDYVPAYQGVFCWDPQFKDVGVDPAGLFVVDTRVRPPREVFRSLRCSQKVIGVTRNLEKQASAAARRPHRPVGHRAADRRSHRQIGDRATERSHHQTRRRVVRPNQATAGGVAAACAVNGPAWCLHRL
jgi:hypothetical protein